MNAIQRFEQAFSETGTEQIPTMIPYDGIFARDHWEELTGCPWWYKYEPSTETQLLWRRRMVERTRQDTLEVPTDYEYSVEERGHLTIESHSHGVYLVDHRIGRERQLHKPRVSGWDRIAELRPMKSGELPETRAEVDSQISAIESNASEPLDGAKELANAVRDEFDGDVYLYSYVDTPLWYAYLAWGFEGCMTLIGSRPDLVDYAFEALIQLSEKEAKRVAALGASAIWVQENFADMISPHTYASLCVPRLQSLIRVIQSNGVKAIYNFTGNPEGRWDGILATGADGLAFEESKKGFTVDVEDVVTRVNGGCTVFGNLDAIGVLRDGTDDQLRSEIERQIVAGRNNGNRFVMCLGSPVTPETPVDRVRLYCDLVHGLGMT